MKADLQLIACALLVFFTSGMSDVEAAFHCSQNETTPQIQIIRIEKGVYESEPEMLAFEEFLIPPQTTSLILTCFFHKPIFWTSSRGSLAHTVTRIKTARTYHLDGKIPRAPCFSISLVFQEIREEITAAYHCGDKENPDSDMANVHMYSGERIYGLPGHLIHRGRTRNITGIYDSNLIVLPCATNIKSANISVYYAEFPNTSQGELQIWKRVTDNAIKGEGIFGVTVSKKVWGIPKIQSNSMFKCKTNIPGDSILFNYVATGISTFPVVEFLPSPGKTDIYSIPPRVEAVFICIASFPTVMIAVKTKLPNTKYSTQTDKISNTNFLISTFLHFTGTGTPSKEIGELNCINNDSVLHSWRHQYSDDKAVNADFRKMHLDLTSRTATCYSIAKEDVEFMYTACETFEECELKMLCLESPDIELECPNTLKLEQEYKTPNSVSVRVPANSGRIRCVGHQLDITTSFFLTTDGKTIAKVDDIESNLYKLNQGELIVAMDLTNSIKCNKNKLQIGDTLLCTCLLVKRFFINEIVWGFEWANGSKFYFNSNDIDEFETNMTSFYHRESIIPILTQEIQSIFCLSFFSWSLGSFQVNQKLDVASRPHCIQGPEVEFVEIDKFLSNTSLSCLSDSYPLANISWKTDVTATYNVSEAQLNNTAIISTLTFANSNNNLDGNFTCYLLIGNVTNLETSVKKTFIIINRSRYEVSQDWNHSLEFIISVSLSMAVLVLLVLAGSIIYCKIRQNQKHNESGWDASLSMKEILSFLEGDSSVRGDLGYENAQRSAFDKNKYQINLSQLKLGKDILGMGAYGIVRKGILLGTSPNEKIEVAVKMVKPNADLDYLKALLGEVKLMTYIGPNHHVAELLGACISKLEKNQLCVVLKFYENGGLDAFLKKSRKRFINLVENDGRFISPAPAKLHTGTRLYENDLVHHGDLSTIQLIRWAQQIAEGMMYLASIKVIHADLATRNILLDENMHIKISDFGLSRQLYLYTQYVKKKEVPLPWRWLAIETLTDMVFSTKSDVWAFGVTMWELFTLAEVPYPGMDLDSEFVRLLKTGYRMPRPDFADCDCYKVMMKCWAFDAEDRPDFEEIVLNLNQIVYPRMETNQTAPGTGTGTGSTESNAFDTSSND